MTTIVYSIDRRVNMKPRFDNQTLKIEVKGNRKLFSAFTRRRTILHVIVGNYVAGILTTVYSYPMPAPRRMDKTFVKTSE